MFTYTIYGKENVKTWFITGGYAYYLYRMYIKGEKDPGPSTYNNIDIYTIDPYVYHDDEILELSNFDTEDQMLNE